MPFVSRSQLIEKQNTITTTAMSVVENNEIAELKQMGVIDEGIEAITQREAHSAVTAEIAQLEAAILDLGR